MSGTTERGIRTQSPSGVFGGGTIGYNMQRGGVVFGIEADFGDMGLSSSKFIDAPAVTPPTVLCSRQLTKRQRLTFQRASTVT